MYAELRRIAGHFLRREPAGHTLQSTAVVHEAYLRLVGQDEAQWRDRAHFLAVAAGMMRRILVDHARIKKAEKRGGGVPTLSLDEALGMPEQPKWDLEALDDALDRLAKLDERQSRIVELRFFAGLSVEETAEALDISPATVKREWATAKLWLLRELGGKSGMGG